MNKQGKWYVSSTDTFLSGWGHAEKLTNKLIFICDSLEEAEAVFENARNRSDQASVQLHSGPPHFYLPEKGDEYVYGSLYVQIKTEADYPKWYQEGAFSLN